MAEHLEELAPDVLLLQEIRALPEQLPKDWQEPEGWHCHWHPAEKKGYAGTAIWSKEPAEFLAHGMGEADPEGRILQLRLQLRLGGVRYVSVYLPSGSRSEEAQTRKEAWMARFATWMAELVDGDEPVVVVGDLNIAHTEADIHNARGNKKTSGFLPHEREWFTELLAQGWRDTLRLHVGDVQGPYSWWSNRGRARELDRGWRIDYVLANPAMHPVTHAFVHRPGGLTVSDHAPVVSDHAPVLVDFAAS
jgi:exodeoxyribonuclease-3